MLGLGSCDRAGLDQLWSILCFGTDPGHMMAGQSILPSSLVGRSLTITEVLGLISEGVNFELDDVVRLAGFQYHFNSFGDVILVKVFYSL